MNLPSIPAGRRAALAALAIAASLAACTDQVEPSHNPVVAAPKSTRSCIVTNRIGRLAYSIDSTTCAGGRATRVETTPASVDNPGLYGITTFHRTNAFEGWSPYNGAADMGITGVRIPIGWDALEPDINGGWNAGEIAKVHEAITQYRMRGIDVYLTVTGTPVWAQKCVWVGDPLQWAWVDSLTVSCNQHPYNPPVDEYMSRWTAAATFMVQEFGNNATMQNAQFFGFGNEPAAMFWPRLRPVDDQQARLNKFVEMSQILANAVHAVPGLKYIGAEANDGSSYYRTWNTPEGQVTGYSPLNNSLNWLSAYMGQAASFTDIFAFHSYKSPSTFQRRYLGKGWGYAIQEYIKEVTYIAQAYNKPMWLTEWGADSWTADPGIRRAVTWDVLQYQNRNPNHRLDRMFAFASFIPYEAAAPQNSGPFGYGYMVLTPTEQYATDSYFCMGTIARLNHVPANGASCTRWNPPLGPYVAPEEPVVAAYIDGPMDLANEQEGTFTVRMNNNVEPVACSWWIDGEFASTGSCTIQRSWNDGASMHVLTAIAFVGEGEEDFATDDWYVAIEGGQCNPQAGIPCDWRKAKALPGQLPAPPSAAKTGAAGKVVKPGR